MHRSVLWNSSFVLLVACAPQAAPVAPCPSPPAATPAPAASPSPAPSPAAPEASAVAAMPAATEAPAAAPSDDPCGENSVSCKAYGECGAPVGIDVACAARTQADCDQSAICKREGYCKWHHGADVSHYCANATGHMHSHGGDPRSFPSLEEAMKPENCKRWSLCD